MRSTKALIPISTRVFREVGNVESERVRGKKTNQITL